MTISGYHLAVLLWEGWQVLLTMRARELNAFVTRDSFFAIQGYAFCLVLEMLQKLFSI